MKRAASALFLLATACPPPEGAVPAQAASKQVIEIYIHPNGLSRCVEEEGERWKADASCCPDGFDLAGFSVPAAIEYLKDDKTKRTLYRHVVCRER